MLVEKFKRSENILRCHQVSLWIILIIISSIFIIQMLRLEANFRSIFTQLFVHS